MDGLSYSAWGGGYEIVSFSIGALELIIEKHCHNPNNLRRLCRWACDRSKSDNENAELREK